MTTDRQQLYDHIIARQRQSMTGRLSTTDTFDLYKTFVAMAEIDEAEGRQRPHEVRIDQQVDEQRLIDLQLSASRSVRHNRPAVETWRKSGKVSPGPAIFGWSRHR